MTAGAEKPRVSIIMPARNGARTLRTAVESVRGQTLEDWELLLIDDGSADETGSIAAELAGVDARIKVLDSGGSGVSVARNLGIEKSTGRYIAFLDADDIYYTNALAARVRELERHQDRTAVFCRTEMVDDSLTKLAWTVGNRPRVTFLDMYTCPFHINSVMVTKESLKNIRFAPAVANGEDWLLWQRLARTGTVFHRVEDCRVAYRLHAGSTLYADPLVHEDSLIDILAIVYGEDADCLEPDPRFADGLKAPEQELVVMGRRFSLIMSLWLRGQEEQAHSVFREFSPAKWGRLTIQAQATQIKFSLLRWLAMPTTDWAALWRDHRAPVTDWLENLYSSAESNGKAAAIIRRIDREAAIGPRLRPLVGLARSVGWRARSIAATLSGKE